MKTNETSNPTKLYSKHYDSYCFWDGTIYKNDGKVSGANFYSLEKAANNGFLPIEQSTKEQALEWWNKMSLEQKFYKVIPWLTSKELGASEIHPDHLTDYEIEEIWRKETEKIDKES